MTRMTLDSMSNGFFGQEYFLGQISHCHFPPGVARGLTFGELKLFACPGLPVFFSFHGS
jgi:hypothetical protein